MIDTTNMFGTQSPSYDEILLAWKQTEHPNPFSGHFLIDFVSEISRIEGIDMSYHRTMEIFSNETIENYTGDIRNLFYVLNNKSLAERLNICLNYHTSLTTDLIKEFHGILMRNSIAKHEYKDNNERAGEFKKKDYCVGKYQVGSPPEKTLSHMFEICKVLNDSECKDPLKLATMFHCNFENIHPFADGNGRLGRWLINYILLRGGHPPLIIRKEDRETYYHCLEEFDIHEDYDSMYNFLKLQTEKSYSAIKGML